MEANSQKTSFYDGDSPQQYFPAISICKSVAAMESYKIRILIIEGNVENEALLIRQLQMAKLDQHVKIVNNGKTAIDYLMSNAQQRDDLVAIFLDFDFPSMGGLDLLKNVQSNDDGRFPPIIVVTSFTSINASENIKNCRNLGVSYFLEKPLTYRTFIKVVADGFQASTTRSKPTWIQHNYRSDFSHFFPSVDCVITRSEKDALRELAALY